MSSDINNTTPLSQRIAFMKDFACFSILSEAACTELAALMTETIYQKGQSIVQEGELIDSVYLIVSGQAEVTQQKQVKKKLKLKTIQELLAVLGSGDAIGLDDAGFFSNTGKRTATVTAITEVKVLVLALKQFQTFFKKYPELQSKLSAMTAQMLRVQLIKQSLPFSHLSYERIQTLANQVEEIELPVGTVIFKQGDKGDRCYLIASGRIEILVEDETGSEKRLAVLKAPTLFGEATLVTAEPRNATARVLETCELLVLRHDKLTELIETEKNVANMFMTLMVYRSRPAKNPRVSAHHRMTADGQAIVILKNPDKGGYFKLSAEGWFIWQQLDGKQTLQSITMLLATQLHIFAPDVVTALISRLAKAGFVENVQAQSKTTTPQVRSLKTGFTQCIRLLQSRYAFGDADKWLTRVYNKSIHWLFKPYAKIVLALLAMSGFFSFLFMTGEIISTFQIMPDVWWLFAGLVPVTILSVALHELGHAFATKSYGREVHYMGVGWFWFGPVAFTDTSDMWLSERWPRIIVNLAGVYTDVLVAGFCGLLILLISNPYIQAFIWLFALFTYMNAFRMMNPLQELDGYYVLMDAVNKPYLRQSAVMWLAKEFPQAVRHPQLFRKNWPEVIYWLVCLVFLILITLITLSVQVFIFKIIGMNMNPYVSVMLSLLIAFISGLGVMQEVKKQAEESL
jgi:putative peptide zinc metalloprotease protein